MSVSFPDVPTLSPTPESSVTEPGAPAWGEMLDPEGGGDGARWIRQGAFLRTTRWLSRQIMHLFAGVWFDFKVNGTEHLPAGGFLLASSHSSHFDAVAMVHALGKRGADMFMLGARDYFFSGSFSTWFFTTFFRILPFDRHGECLPGLNLAHQVLKDGHPLLIYPEGTRSPDGSVQPFKPGVGLLGVELGMPIVPCLIQGTFASLPRGKWWPRRSKVSVTFGRPLKMEDFRARLGEMSRGQLYRQVARDLHREVIQLGADTPRC